MNRLKRAAITAATLPMMAAGPLFVGPSPTAEAATGTLTGLFGSAPRFSSVSVDGSSVCPCWNIAYDFWPGQAGIADGVDALDTWISTTWGRKTVLAFSKGTHSVLGWIRTNEDDSAAHTIRFYLLGSPETPGNNYPYEGYKFGRGLPETGDYENVTFIVRQYDGIADAPYDKFNFLALLNASVSMHLNGYDNLDLDNPDAVFIDPETGAETRYFRTDVLPILAPIDWITSDEQMAKLDALLRPLIEAAYRRPVEIPAPPYSLARQSKVVSPSFASTTEALIDDTAGDDALIDAPEPADGDMTEQSGVADYPGGPAAEVATNGSEPDDLGQDAEEEVDAEADPGGDLVTDEAATQAAIGEVGVAAEPADAAVAEADTSAATADSDATAPAKHRASKRGPESAEPNNAPRHRAPLHGASTSSSPSTDSAATDPGADASEA